VVCDHLAVAKGKGPGRTVRVPEALDPVDAVCVSLRRQGYTLSAIAGKLQEEFRRSYTQQAVHQRLKKVAATQGGTAALPTRGFVWLRQARAALGLSVEQLGRRIMKDELRAKWRSGQRLLSVSDLRRLWPRRWKRAQARMLEAAKAGRERRRPRGQSRGRPRSAPRPQALPVIAAMRSRAASRQVRPEALTLAVTHYPSYRRDYYCARVVKAVDEIRREKGTVAPVEVFVRLGLLRDGDVDAWQRGDTNYLEKLLSCDLGKATRVLGILRMHAHALGLKPVRAVYLKADARPRYLLRFTRDEDVNVETAYSTHYTAAASRSKAG
jgi:hypothetical protein